MPARIAVNGYGTIGKRVADAVVLQDDMRLAGVAKTKPDFEAKLAARQGYAVYAATPDGVATFEKAGVKPAGTPADLVKEPALVVAWPPQARRQQPLVEKTALKADLAGGLV